MATAVMFFYRESSENSNFKHNYIYVFGNCIVFKIIFTVAIVLSNTHLGVIPVHGF